MDHQAPESSTPDEQLPPESEPDASSGTIPQTVVIDPQTFLSELELVADALSVDQRYEITGQIARGGMGEVLNARDVNCRRNVAMKVMLGQGNMKSKNVVRFVEEAQVTAQLEHPGIVPVHELGLDDDGNVFYTMKFVRGITLQAILDRISHGDEEMTATYPLAQLLTIHLKICDAVAFAHSRGVLHRDLKPENVMIGDYGEVLVVDWGLAKILGRETDQDAEQDDDKPPSWITEDVESLRNSLDSSGLYTIEGFAMGTPQYMAPEQAFGKLSELDARTDLYALGGILYAILTLHPPVMGSSIQDILQKVVRGEIDYPTRRLSPTVDEADIQPTTSVPAGLAAVAMKALATDPDDRYPDVPTLQRDITAHMTGFATEAEDASALRHLQLFIARHKLATSSIAAVVLALAVGMSLALHQRQAAVNALRAAEASAKEARDQSQIAEAHARDANAQRHAAMIAQDQAEASAEQARDISMRAAPEFIDKAIRELSQGRRKTASESAAIACELAPDGPDAWFIAGRIALARLQIAESTASFDLARRHGADPHSVRAYLAIIQQIQASQIPNGGYHPERFRQVAVNLNEINDGILAAAVLDNQNLLDHSLDLRMNAAIAAMLEANPGSRPGTITDLGNQTYLATFTGRKINTIEPLAGLPITELRLSNTSITSCEPLRGMDLRILFAASGRLTDIDALGDMPLQRLYLGDAQITSLEPLRDLQLTQLSVARSAVTDLSPLSDMPIVTLNISHTGIEDLSPLAGMPLQHLEMSNTKITDITPLTGVPLHTLINKYSQVEDLRPLSALPLTHLDLAGSRRLTDLDPIRHCPLEYLDLSNIDIDIAPIQHMPLHTLYVDMNKQSAETLRGLRLDRLFVEINRQKRDLPILRDMAIRQLDITCANPPDISQFDGKELDHLTIRVTRSGTFDLSGLTDIRIKSLQIRGNISIPDLTPLASGSLTSLQISGAKLPPLTPLSYSETLQHIKISGSDVDYAELRNAPVLKTINGKPADQVW